MCVIVFLVLTVVAAVMGWLSIDLLAGWAAEAGWIAVAISVVLIPVLVLLAHEAGHLLAGLAAGMPPVMMIVGPFGLHWKRNRFLPQFRTGEFVPGGFTLCIPRSGHAIRTRMLVMTAGGPLASLVLAAAAAVPALAADGNLRFAAGYTALLSAGLFALTAFPGGRRGMTSDGAKIRLLREDTRQSRALAANLGLLAAARGGQAISEWPLGLIETALAAETGTPEQASALHFAYWAALDEGDHALAEERLAKLQKCTSEMSEAIAAPVAFEAAAFHLFVRGQAAAARALIDGRRPPVFQDRYLEPLVRAGLALAAGERSGAAAFARQAREWLDHALFPAVADLHARWLEQIETRIACGDNN